MAKSKLKLEAIKLRHNGESIKHIAEKLFVSSSTASLWCRDVVLTKMQIEKLIRQGKDPNYGRRLENSLKQKRVREITEKLEMGNGRKLIRHLEERDLLIAGVALYWAEGFKKDKMVGFSNSDPEMIKFILGWLNLIGVDKNMFRFRVIINQSHIYRANVIQDYWQKILKLDKELFYKPTFQKTIQKKKYENEDKYFGVLRIRVLKSTNLLRRIKGMISGLAQNVYEN